MAIRRRLLEQGTRRAKKRAQDEASGKNPTDRRLDWRASGVKKSLLVEGDGGPLALAISGANVPDAHLLALTLDAIVVERPQPTEIAHQHLCLDKGYDNPTGEQAALAQAYTPHILRIGEEKLDDNQEKKNPARR